MTQLKTPLPVVGTEAMLVPEGSASELSDTLTLEAALFFASSTTLKETTSFLAPNNWIALPFHTELVTLPPLDNLNSSRVTLSPPSLAQTAVKLTGLGAGGKLAVGEGLGEGDKLGDGEGLGDGITEGLGLGEGLDEGDTLGEGLGDTDGDTLGLGEGLIEGLGSGLGEGLNDGEGLGDGVALGEGDGLTDGEGVGEDDTLGLGDGDKEGDGEGEGLTDGLGEGLGLGGAVTVGVGEGLGLGRENARTSLNAQEERLKVSQNAIALPIECLFI